MRRGGALPGLLLGIAAVAAIPFSAWWAATGGLVDCPACRPWGICPYCEGAGRISIATWVLRPPPDPDAILRERATRCDCGAFLRGTHPECEWSGRAHRPNGCVDHGPPCCGWDVIHVHNGP